MICLFYSKKIKETQKGTSYCRHGNTTLPNNMKYNAQCYDEKNKQHFMWVNSSELKSENRIMEIRYLFLSSLHIGLHTGDAKYRNYSRKIKTIANITIHKITERIESYTVLGLLMMKEQFTYS